MSRIMMYGAAVVLLVFSLVLVAAGPTSGILAVGLVLVVVCVACFGPDAVGIGFMGLAFVTAPMYKGLAPAGSPVTPTDLFLAASFVLLLPRLVGGTFRLPSVYVGAVAVVLVTGIVGSLASDAPTLSVMALVFWLVAMFVLPTGIDLWHPDLRTVNALAWLFVFGHLVSTAYGLLIGGPVGQGRYLGLTQHPNYFAESGVVAFGLLLHLLATAKNKWPVWPAMAIVLYSVVLSGSRAGTLAVAAIILIIPYVERSAIKGYLLAFGAAVAAAAFTTTLSTAALGGSFERLTGGGSASGSDAVRTQGLIGGWNRFLDHPLSGSGLIDLFDVHNNYLEAAIGVGIFGFVAFMVILWTLVKPLLGRGEMRRLCYVVFGYGIFGATTPSIYDRTFWVAMSLSILAVTATAAAPVQPPLSLRREPASPRMRARMAAAGALPTPD